MKKFMKWASIGLGGLLVLTVLAGLVLYSIGMKKLIRTYPNIKVEAVNIPTDADAIVRGKHISIIWSCTKCHGDYLSGKIITNDPVENDFVDHGSLLGSARSSASWRRSGCSPAEPYPPHECRESTLPADPPIPKGTFLLCQIGDIFILG